MSKFKSKTLAGAAFALPVMLAVTLAPSLSYGASLSEEAEDSAINNLEIQDDDPIVYTPPVMGAPGDRIGAGTRGVDANTDNQDTQTDTPPERMMLLAPKGGGLTLSEAPRLYWWLPGDFKGRIVVMLQADKADRAILAFKQPFAGTAGRQEFDLAKFGVRLAQDKTYYWTIQLTDAQGKSWANQTSFIKRVEKAVETDSGDPVAHARALAASGIWYDAYATLADDPKLDAQGAKLLASAGLTPSLAE